MAHNPLLAAVLAVVPPSAAATDVAQRLATAGARMEEAEAAQMLVQLAAMGLVRVTRRGERPTYVTTTLGNRVIDGGPGGELSVSLTELEALRTDLVSTIAHELRTPLTSVRMSVGLLLDPNMRPDEEQRATLLRSIERNADRMQRLIADILDLSRFRAGTVTLQLRRFRAVALAQSAISVVAPLAAQNGVRVELDAQTSANHEAYGDRRRLEQALLNLLSNAVRFSASGMTVKVGCSADDAETWWRVSDTGAGISADDQARLFERYFVGRGDSSGSEEGVGLGLPTALAIAQAHSGRIEVDSALGSGSTFTLVVPTGGPEERSE